MLTTRNRTCNLWRRISIIHHIYLSSSHHFVARALCIWTDANKQQPKTNDCYCQHSEHNFCACFHRTRHTVIMNCAADVADTTARVAKIPPRPPVVTINAPVDRRVESSGVAGCHRTIWHPNHTTQHIQKD